MVRNKVMMLFWAQLSFSLLSSSFENIQVVQASKIDSVYSSPRIEILPKSGQEYTVKELKTLVIYCKATGHPKPTIKWTIYGGGLVRRNLDMYNSTLALSNLTRSESGRVTCKATNGIGNPVFATKRINVVYLDKPLLTIQIPIKTYVPSTSIWFANTVYLHCSVASNPPPTFAWKRNNTLIEFNRNYNGISIQPNPPYKPSLSTSVLQIKNARSSDFGNYECHTSLNQIGIKTSILDTKDVLLYSSNIAPPQIRLRSAPRVVVNKGESVRMICDAQGGFPKPTITWMRQDGVSFSNRVVITKRNNLVISNTTYEDSGNYLCIGSNRVGIPTQKRVHVTVRRLGSMTFWISPMRGYRKLSMGVDVWLTCHADAEPSSEVRYTWYKMSNQNARKVIPKTFFSDNNKMSISRLCEDEVKRAYTIPAVSSRLEMHELTDDDYGVYVCSATLTGFDNSSVEVFARIPIGKDSAPPKISAVMKIVIAQEKQNATLQCTANGSPSPTFRFYREENRTLPNGNSEEFSQNGFLVLTKVSRDDVGTYYCSAALFNGFSKRSANPTWSQAEIELKVEYPPTVQPVYTLIRKPQGAALNLTCFVADSLWEYPLTYQWTKDGVLQGKLQTSEQMHYPSIDKNHYGIYTCTVSNSIGSNNCVMNVTNDAYPPDFYYSDQDGSYLQTTDTGALSMYSYFLSWTQKLPNAVEPVIEYRIRWRLIKKFSAWQNHSVYIPGGAKLGQPISYKLTDLETGRYYVEVVPITIFGDGSPATRIIQVKSRISDLNPRDVSPTTHSLSKEYFCTFDFPKKCLFVQSKTDDLDWTLNSESTQLKRTESTGPDADHSNFDKTGGYMFIESSNVKAGDRARLISPTFWHETSQRHCLKFFYHMKGRHIGKLRVLLSEKTGKEVELWKKEKEQGKTWLYALINLSPRTEYRIIFEAVMKDGFQGDIAIDDIIVDGDECELPPTTSNENLFPTTPQGGGAGSLKNQFHFLPFSIWKFSTSTLTLLNYFVTVVFGYFCSFSIFV